MKQQLGTDFTFYNIKNTNLAPAFHSYGNWPYFFQIYFKRINRP